LKKKLSFESLESRTLFCATASANTCVSIDLATQRYVGDVSELDRGKYFNLHGVNNDGQINAFMEEYDVQGGRQFWGPLRYAKNSTGAVGVYPRTRPSSDESVRPVQQLVQTHAPWDAVQFDMDLQAAADWVVTYYTTIANNVPEYFEPMNEPFVHAWTGDFAEQQPIARLMRVRMAELFAEIGKAVDASPALANMNIIGYAAAWPEMELGNFDHWKQQMKMFMDIAGKHMDALSTHLYDGVNVTGQNTRRSGSNSEAVLDLIETYSHVKWDFVKPHAITEYGGIPKGYGDEYSDIRAAQSLRSVNHLLFNLLERQDDLAISIPFITDKSLWFLEAGSCEPYGAALWRLSDPNLANCTGSFEHTWKIHFYDLWKDVQGDRALISTSDPDVQAQLFVDGNTAYVAVNNFADTSETVDLEVVSGMSGLQSVEVRRMEIPVDASLEPSYTETTQSTAPDSVTLGPGGTTVLVYEFDSALSFTDTIRSKKYFTDQHLEQIRRNRPITFNFDGVEVGNKGFAKLRMGIGRPHTGSKTPQVMVNGNVVTVPNDWKGYDQADRASFFGMIEIPVPIEFLETNNTVEVTFPDPSGRISSMILNVEKMDGPIDTPTALDDSFSGTEDTVISDSVSANDTLSSDGGNVYAVLSASTNGALSMRADGTFDYTPNNNFNGIDTFTYRLRDATGDTSDATVTLELDAVNDSPQGAGDQFEITEGTELSGTVAENDSFGDDENLFTIVLDARNGTLLLDEDGTFSYAPNQGYTGNDLFVYRLQDADGDYSEAIVNLTISESEVEDLVGDVDRDGDVDFADFLIFSSFFGQTDTEWVKGDFNGDAKTDFQDFLLFSTNFGRTLA